MSLKDDIITRIRSDGPMRIDEYMSTCLLHPTKGVLPLTATEILLSATDPRDDFFS